MTKPKRYQRFSSEFKREAIMRASEVGMTDKAVCDELEHLRDNCQLIGALDIPDAAAPIDVVADMQRRTIDVGMTLKAPDDRKSSKARVNWLLKQIRGAMPDDLQIRCNWPGRSDATLFSYSDLANDPSAIEDGKQTLQVLSFHIFISRRLGGRFIQQSNFIVDLEKTVPEFYRLVGQNLSAWKKSAPKIKSERETADEVSVAAIEEDLGDAFEA